MRASSSTLSACKFSATTTSLLVWPKTEGRKTADGSLYMIFGVSNLGKITVTRGFDNISILQEHYSRLHYYYCCVQSSRYKLKTTRPSTHLPCQLPVTFCIPKVSLKEKICSAEQIMNLFVFVVDSLSNVSCTTTALSYMVIDSGSSTYSTHASCLLNLRTIVFSMCTKKQPGPYTSTVVCGAPSSAWVVTSMLRAIAACRSQCARGGVQCAHTLSESSGQSCINTELCEQSICYHGGT